MIKEPCGPVETDEVRVRTRITVYSERFLRILLSIPHFSEEVREQIRKASVPKSS